MGSCTDQRPPEQPVLVSVGLLVPPWSGRGTTNRGDLLEEEDPDTHLGISGILRDAEAA